MGLISKLFGLFRHKPVDNLQLPKATKKAAKVPDKLPDDVVLTKTGAYSRKQTDECVEWQLLGSEKEATIQVTSADMEQIRKRNLSGDMVKAFNFKRAWVSGSTASEAAAAMGASLSTAEKYWASFNHSVKNSNLL